MKNVFGIIFVLVGLCKGGSSKGKSCYRLFCSKMFLMFFNVQMIAQKQLLNVENGLHFHLLE